METRARWAVGQRRGAKWHHVIDTPNPLIQVATCGVHLSQADEVELLQVHQVAHFACPRCVAMCRNRPVFTDEGSASGWDESGHAIGRPLADWR